MRVVAYVQEPLSNAGSRCRIAALAPGLAAQGIDLRVCPPMSDGRGLGSLRVCAELGKPRRGFSLKLQEPGARLDQRAEEVAVRWVP